MAFSREFEKIMADEKLTQEVDTLESLDDAKKYFAEKGVDLEAELRAVKVDEEELDETDLDEVAGGSAVAVTAAILIGGAWIVGRTAGIAIRRGWDAVVNKNINKTYSKSAYSTFGAF